jgi:hypothetical protein
MSLSKLSASGESFTLTVPKLSSDGKRFALYRQSMLMYLSSVGLVKYLNDKELNKMVKPIPIIKSQVGSESSSSSSGSSKEEAIDVEETFKHQSRVCYLLFTSMNSSQQSMFVKMAQAGDCEAMWKKINDLWNSHRLY